MELISEIEFWPADEVRKLMRAFGKAREKRDTDSLVWCADRMLFLYRLSEEGEIEPSHDQVEMMFNMAFRDNLPKPPPLIAGIMVEEEMQEPSTDGKALERELDRLDTMIEIHASRKDAEILREQIEKIREAVTGLTGEGVE